MPITSTSGLDHRRLCHFELLSQATVEGSEYTLLITLLVLQQNSDKKKYVRVPITSIVANEIVIEMRHCAQMI